METKPVKVGVVGAGRIGRVHAENLALHLAEADLVAISDVVEASAKRCAEELEIPRVFDDHRRILEDPRIEAIVICSSTDTHAAIIQDAAQAGKHVFVDKPIAHTVAHGKALTLACKEAGVVLSVGYQRRRENHFRWVRRAIEEGNLAGFQSQFRTVDALVIDDVQFLRERCRRSNLITKMSLNYPCLLRSVMNNSYLLAY